MFSCHRAVNNGYHNFNKWQLLAGVGDRPFSGHPRWVTEYPLAAADSANPQKKHELYYKYGFDDDGDLIHRSLYMDDKLFGETDYRYDAGGRQDIAWASGGPDTTRTVSRSIGEGRFISIYYTIKGKPRSTYIHTFPAGGQEDVQEEYDDTTATGKPISTLHSYYDGARLIRATSVSKRGRAEQRFFYSKWDAPDSVHTYDETKLVLRQIYHNNAQGDPDRSYAIEGKDTEDRHSWRYVYDRHGNWTRKIETTPGADKIVSPLGPARTVVEREFVY